LVTATSKPAQIAANSHFPTLGRRRLSFIDELHRFFSSALLLAVFADAARGALSVLSSRDTRRKNACSRIVTSAGEIDLE
jgi:hypothetical protein